MWQTGLVDFDVVYERFRLPVWRLVCRLTTTEEEALDVSQEIFLRVWRGLPGFRGEAKLSTWVFQIAWNYIRAHRRKMGRQHQIIGRNISAAQDLVESAVDTGPDPERRARATQLLDRIGVALDTLPEHYRVVVWLRDGEDLSYQEIADALEIPIGTVRSRLARARGALKEIVES